MLSFHDLLSATERAVYSNNTLLIKNGSSTWLTIAKPQINVTTGTLTYTMYHDTVCNIVSISNTPGRMTIICDTCQIIYTF